MNVEVGKWGLPPPHHPCLHLTSTVFKSFQTCNTIFLVWAVKLKGCVVKVESSGPSNITGHPNHVADGDTTNDRAYEWGYTTAAVEVRRNET